MPESTLPLGEPEAPHNDSHCKEEPYAFIDELFEVIDPDDRFDIRQAAFAAVRRSVLETLKSWSASEGSAMPELKYEIHALESTISIGSESDSSWFNELVHRVSPDLRAAICNRCMEEIRAVVFSSTTLAGLALSGGRRGSGGRTLIYGAKLTEDLAAARIIAA